MSKKPKAEWFRRSNGVLSLFRGAPASVHVLLVRKGAAGFWDWHISTCWMVGDSARYYATEASAKRAALSFARRVSR